MSEPVQPSAAPALDVEECKTRLTLILNCKHEKPCPYCRRDADLVLAEVARLRALQETKR